MNGQKESYPEKFPRPDVGIQQQRKAKGDRILNQHAQDIIDHVEQGVPEIGVIDQRSQIVETVELWRVEGRKIPVREGNINSEESGKDHHHNGEQQGRQQKQCAMSRLAANHDLARAKRHRPQNIGIKHRPPVLETCCYGAGRIKTLHKDDCGKAKRGCYDQAASGPLTRLRNERLANLNMLSGCDRVRVLHGVRGLPLELKNTTGGMLATSCGFVTTIEPRRF